MTDFKIETESTDAAGVVGHETAIDQAEFTTRYNALQERMASLGIKGSDVDANLSQQIENDKTTLSHMSDLTDEMGGEFDYTSNKAIEASEEAGRIIGHNN